MSVTVNKLDYIYKKLLNEVKSKMNDTIEISDEEYGIIYEGNDVGNQGGNDEPIESIPGEETIDKLTADMVFEIYENIDNDLILDIKLHSLLSCKLEGIDKTDNTNWINKSISLNYGQNIITSFIKYSFIYEYSYEEKNSLVLKVNYNNKEYQFDVVFELQNDKSFYECKIIQNPKFIFDIKTYDNFEIRLVDPLIISQKNIEKSINDILDYNFYIINSINYEPYKSNDLLNDIGDINNNSLEFIYKFDINKTYEITPYIYNGGYLLKIEYNQDCITWKNNIFNLTKEFTKASYWPAYNEFHITDYYNLGKYYGSELINNFENNNVNKIEEINYTFKYDYYNYCGPEKQLKCGFSDNQDFIDLLCQKLNCQKTGLRIYNNCEWPYFNGSEAVDSFRNTQLDTNQNNQIINIYKDINLISGNSTSLLNYYGRSGNTSNYWCNYNKFKLFVTANNIDYILINCGWDIFDKDKNHYLIDPITNEHISINEYDMEY